MISYDSLWKKIVDLKILNSQMGEKAGISNNTSLKWERMFRDYRADLHESLYPG